MGLVVPLQRQDWRDRLFILREKEWMRSTVPRLADSPGGTQSGVERSQLWRALRAGVVENGLIFASFLLLPPSLWPVAMHAGTPGPGSRPTAPFGNVVGWTSQLLLLVLIECLQFWTIAKEKHNRISIEKQITGSQEDSSTVNATSSRCHLEELVALEPSVPTIASLGREWGFPFWAEGQNFPGSMSHTDDQTLHPQGLGTCMGSVFRPDFQLSSFSLL